MADSRLAVIGGGASCVLLLAHLAANPSNQDMMVDVYDRTGRFGRGIAYSTKQESHLLNVRAANMSAFQHDKNDFANWAAKLGYGASDFVPRKIYGDYLEEKLSDARKILDVRLITQDVGSVHNNKIGDKSYTHVILATGNVRPLRPAVQGAVAGYYDDPWSVNFAPLLKAKTIALVGSGLSAVDMIVALNAQNYQGKIMVFSRRGHFPAVHVDPVSYPSFLTESGYGGPLSLLRQIRQHVKKAAIENIPWQAVIDSLRPHTNAIWQSWDSQDRARFMKRLFTFWNIHRHRMAPEIAKILVRQKTEVIRADVKEIVEGPVIVTRKGERYEADAVINCLGYRYEEEGQEGAYDVTARLGPPCFGDLFETTAIPEIREQAQQIAEMIAK